MNQHLRVTILLLCLALPLVTAAQSLLDKNVSSFSIHRASPDEALRSLAEKAQVHFSYKTDILEQRRSLTLSVNNKTLRQILQLLFGDAYEYQEQQDFIIVMKRYSYYVLSGMVCDQYTGRVMDSVQVGSANGIFTAITDKEGRFGLKVPDCYSLHYLVLKKDFYLDAFVQLKTTADQELRIYMQPVTVRELSPVVATAGVQEKEKGIALHPLFNVRRKSTGFEAGSLFNINKGNTYNIQLAGAVNIAGKSLKGVQLAGIHNLVMDSVKGVQLAGLVNKTQGPVRGVQIAVINHAHKLRGVQVGLINITDSSDGYSIGLLNFVRNASGYHSVSFLATDLTTSNISVKMGNARLYTIFYAGMNMVPGKKLHTAGIGLGHDERIGNKLAVSTEAIYQAVNAGSWDNRLLQLKTSLNMRVAKGWSLFAGPVFYWYTSNQDKATDRYKNMGVYGYKASRNWLGWQAGITSADVLWLNGKQYVQKESGWSLQLGGSGGVSFDQVDGAKWITGDMRLQKAVADNSMAVMLTAAYNHRFHRSFVYDATVNPAAPGLSSGFTAYLLKLGLKVFVIRKFYAAFEAGTTLNKIDEVKPGEGLFQQPVTLSKRRLVLAPAIGWAVGQRLDISARFETVKTPMLLRLGYTVWKSRH
jgi:hypothetical protein